MDSIVWVSFQHKKKSNFLINILNPFNSIKISIKSKYPSNHNIIRLCDVFIHNLNNCMNVCYFTYEENYLKNYPDGI